MSINEMFITTESTGVTSSARSLAGTAQLTLVASKVATAIIDNISITLSDPANDGFETCNELFEASKVDHVAMDKLIAQMYDLDSVDTEFIKELDEATVNGMLKSQQSKRSRAKGKPMTIDNYRSMLVGAVAENLLRNATGKMKLTGGTCRASCSLTYTDEELDEFAADQERLKRELRNVQSKKSIMKSKADFSPEDERWKQLLIAEESLKSRRVVTPHSRVVRVDETKDALKAKFADVDLESISAKDSKALLAQITEFLK